MSEGMAIWILLAAAFGLIIGWAFGEAVSQRDCAEEKVEDLRAQLSHVPLPLQERQLKELRGVVNDVHRMVRAVTKSLEKRPS